MLKNKIILVISNEGWGPVWYSKHNWANELSVNNKVFFVNPPSRWSFSGIFSSNIKNEFIIENLSVLNYKNCLPSFIFLLNRLNNYIVSKRIRKFFKKQNQEPEVFWSFDPTRLYVPFLFGTNFSLFHCVDDYHFTFKSERILYKHVNCIIIVSTHLLNNFRNISKPKYVISHGVSSLFLEDSKCLDNEIKLISQPFGLYIGNIDKRLDFNLLRKFVISFPSVNFVVAGPDNTTNGNDAYLELFIEKRYSNFYYLGSLPFNSLPQYISQCSFGFSFRDLSIRGVNVSSHKTFLYFSKGKPLFTYKLDEYVKVEELLYMSNDNNKVISLLRNYLENGESQEVVFKRIKFAHDHSFTSLIREIEQILISEGLR